MKILHLVEFYHPSVGGAQECVKQISERLVTNGHEVTVYTSALPKSKTEEIINGVHVKRFDVAGNIVRGITGKDAERFKKMVTTSKFDVVMCYAAQQWTFDLFNEVIDQVSAKKVLVPCGFSGLNDAKYTEYFKLMPGWLRRYDELVLLSNTYQDAQFIQAQNLTNTTLIPNCADEREFASVLSSTQVSSLRKKYGLQKKVICTIGGFTGIKGQLESMAVFKRLPMRNVTLVVIGNNDFDPGAFIACQKFAAEINSAQQSKGKKVLLLETGKDVNRKQTIELLKLADIFLFLSYLEASPLVIFESMAAGTAYISTRVGNVAEIIKWTHAGLGVSGTKDSNGMFRANNINALLKVWFMLLFSPFRNHLAKNGRAAFETKYNWKKCSEMYEALYWKLVK